MFKWIYKWTEELKNKLNEKGQGMVEYGIVLAVVAAIALAVFGNVSGEKTVTGEGGTTSTEKVNASGLSGAVEKAYDSATKTVEKATPTIKE